MTHNEPGLLQSAIDRRDQSVDRIRGQPEEVEVARLPPNVAARDQRRTTREREAFRFGEAGDDRGDLLLRRAQHLRGESAALDPARPRLPDGRRQHELVPELEQAIGVDVETHVMFRSLPQHLLVHAGPIGPLGEVVRDSWAAPANAKGELDSTTRFRQGRVVQVDRNRYGPCRRAKGRCPGLRHRNYVYDA